NCGGVSSVASRPLRMSTFAVRHQSSSFFGVWSLGMIVLTTRPHAGVGLSIDGSQMSTSVMSGGRSKLLGGVSARAACMKSRTARYEIEVEVMLYIGELSELPAQTPVTRSGV